MVTGLNMECKAYLDEHFTEVNAEEFYGDIFADDLSESKESEEYAYHAILLAGDKHDRVNVWRDLTAIWSAQGREKTCEYLAPCSYIGTRRVNKNARKVYALTIDVDHLKPHGTDALFNMVELDYLPSPTYTVWSGRGMHLYFVFDEPVKAYKGNIAELQKYKTALSKKLLNPHITERCEESGKNAREIESVLQAMRVVGSGTKDGTQTARAYLTGERVSIDYLNRFVPSGISGERTDKRIYLESDRVSKAVSKYPKWYMERVIEKRDPKYWNTSKAVYEDWKKRIRNEGAFGHRYFAIMTLAIYAKKCGVSFGELERDAYDLLPVLDALTVNGEHFTERDLKSALRAYDKKYITFPNYWISKLSAIPITPNKRNGRTREDHLELARKAKEQKKRNGTMKREGRPSKASVVQEWRSANMKGKKSDCIRETGLSKKTVYKHWNITEETTAPNWTRRNTFSDYEDLRQYILNTVPEAEQENELVRISSEMVRIAKERGTL